MEQNNPQVEIVNTETQDYKYMQTTTINLSKNIPIPTFDMYRDNTSK